MKRIYFAGPLFCQAEIEFNEKLAKQLEDCGFSLYLPQRDSAINDQEYQKADVDEQQRLIFKKDYENVLKADIMLFILDGRIPDEGACVELGIAYTHKSLQKPEKMILGLMTDLRSAFKEWKLNPMVHVPFEFIASSVDELMDYLPTHCSVFKDDQKALHL